MKIIFTHQRHPDCLFLLACLGEEWAAGVTRGVLLAAQLRVCPAHHQTGVCPDQHLLQVGHAHQPLGVRPDHHPQQVVHTQVYSWH